MKAILAITIYVLFKDLPLDAILGIVAGVSFALLVALLFVGPTPKRQPKPMRMPAQRHARKAIKPAYVFVPTNYEWSAA